MKRLLSMTLLAAAMFCSCEQIELASNTDDGATNNEQTVLPRPVRTGDGTVYAPYTVDEFIEKGNDMSEESAWVIGYAVGTAYLSMKNAEFIAPFSHESNILLAPTPQCTTAANCLPVMLKTKADKTGISLVQNPSKHQQCLMIKGRPEKYLNTTGIRTIDRFQWFEGYTFPSTNPSEWNDTIQYAID